MNVVAGNGFEVYLKKSEIIWISWNESNIYSSIAGDEIQTVYFAGWDDTPLYGITTHLNNGFSGFRI